MDNITENNKLIAEFMGSLFINDPYKDKDGNVKDYWYWTKPNYDYPKSIGIGELSTAWNIGNFHFHDDWNWLMKVVEKIEAISVSGKQWTVLNDNSDVDWNFEVKIEGKQCTINRCAYDGDEEDFLNLYDCRHYEQNRSKIEVVFSSIVIFIKWYKEKNKKNESL